MLSPVSPTFRSPKCRRFVIEPRPTSDVWRSIDGGAFSVQDGAAGHSPEFKPAVANIKGYKKWWLVCHYIGLSQSTGRRKFRSQTSDNTDRGGKSQREKGREEKRRRKKHFVFPMICGSGGSKSRLAKAAGVEPSGQRFARRCGRKPHFQVKMQKAPQLRSTFGSWDVETGHAVVARSRFASQNVQNTSCSDHFWKLRCRKSGRRCGVAHVQVKMHKAHQVRSTFGSWDVETGHAVVARSRFASQNVQNTSCSDHFWKLRCRKSGRRCGEAHVQVKMHKAHQVRSTFGSWDVEKVLAVVARSTCPSQNV